MSLERTYFFLRNLRQEFRRPAARAVSIGSVSECRTSARAVSRYLRLSFLWLGFLALGTGQAKAGSEHLVSVSSQVTSIGTKFGNQDIKILSPFGAVARYDYRPGFSSSFYTNYVVVSDGKGIILNSYGFGGDYSLLGGITKRFTANEDNSFEFYYGYRLSVFAGFSFGTYDFGNFVDSSSFSLGDKIKSKGRISGLEMGLGMEFNLASDSMVVSRLSFSSPSIENNSQQSGNVWSLSVGLGKIL